jgi:hypothetical protein
MNIHFQSGIHLRAATEQVDGNRVRSGLRSRRRVYTGFAQHWIDSLRGPHAVSSSVVCNAGNPFEHQER